MLSFGKNKNSDTDTLIIYASVSGNAKKVAQLAHKYLKKNRYNSVCKNIKDVSPHKLIDVKNLLIVISTHGAGVPPPSANTFFKEITASDMSPLPNLNYSVCALGDSNYPLFCEAGRLVDKHLKELSAKSFYPRTECDVDFSNKAIEWIKGTYGQLNSK